ncbi:uncharacterized protein N7500_002833 [Penicillium coprophilum]|uniref:uncharacterized protein n=1 Tax=Penicillium coprophilum TaxID=36646 RepID=UPI00238BE7A2|nr:uncharacterized protein N7500_002833 [Penicillium coprophilum]KAJ5170050.1 hypothetical protein N7500_002833 [Penicillium coprophilum]
MQEVEASVTTNATAWQKSKDTTERTQARSRTISTDIGAAHNRTQVVKMIIAGEMITHCAVGFVS